MKTVARWTAIGVLSVLVLAMLWGFVVEPRLIDEVHLEAALPNLPTEWDGAVFAEISDLQVGMVLDNTGTVERMVDRILEADVDGVFLTGDFIYAPNDPDPGPETEAVVDLLRPLGSAGVPCFAILGNHDYGQLGKGAKPRAEVAGHLAKRLEDIGITVLQNEAVPLRAGRETALWIVGVDSVRAGRSKPDVALANVPDGAPRVVLMHNPDSFAGFPAGTAPLAFAGHTHGGQIRIPFLDQWTWLNWVWGGEVHADGWIHGYGAPGNRLYVNRGVGFSILPIRINSPPELDLVTLQAGDARTAVGAARGQGGS